MNEYYEQDDTPSVSAIRAVASLWHPTERSDPVPHRESVRTMLEKMAQGFTDSDTMWFSQQLAASLCAADIDAPKAANQRAQAVLAATGLAGADDKYERFCSSVQDMIAFGAGTNNAIELSLKYFPNPTGQDGPDLFKAAEKIWHRKKKEFPPM